MRRLIPLLLAALLLLGGCAPAAAPPSAAPPPEGSAFQVLFMDVGQADAALVLCDGQSLLIDGGNKADGSTVVAILKEQGITHLDVVVGSHAHEDHIGGLAGVLAAFGADRVLCSVDGYDSKAFDDFAKYAKARGPGIEIPKAGDRFDLGSASVEILAPLAAYEDANNLSIVLRITYGETVFLFTGDAERTSETDMLDAELALSADVLKVGHHGSDTSTSYRFLNEVMPQYAVISVGADNPYGHPHEEVLSRFRDADAEVLRTDLQGDILIESDGVNLTVTTQWKASPETLNPTVGEKTGSYIGNINSKIFHKTSCTSLPAEHNRVYFDSRSEAADAGFTPCGNCKP